MPKKKIDLEKEQITKAQEKEKEELNVYKIELSEDQETELVERVIYLVDKDVADRSEYMAIRQKVRDYYEGKVTPKNDPWVNCANVKTQLVHMSTELLHARLFPSAWNEDLIYWQPMESQDIENVENVSKFMKWAAKRMKLSSVVDDFVHNIVLDGTAVMKIRWVTEYKWVQRKIPVESVSDKIKNIIHKFIGGKKTYEVKERKYKIEYEYKKFEYCKAEVPDIEDVGFPTYSVPSSNEEELEYIWHRSYPSYSELLEMQARGYYENVEEIGTYLDNILTEGTKKADIDAEGTKITQNKLNQRTEIIEFYDKYDYNDDGIREDIIVTIEKKSKILLDCRPLLAISRINERPFIIGQFIRRTNRMLGKGAGEIAMPFEEEANTIHNQRLDAGTMSIIPFGVYRAGSGFKPENISMAPGLWIPVDDVNDAKWITVANNVMVSFQEERMLMELLEKILSVGSYQSGQESDVNRSRSTARGTLAIIQQGEVRFNILAQRVQKPLTRALNKILHQWQDKIPPGLAVRVLGKEGEELFPDGIAPEDLAGDYDSYMVLDSTGGSKRMDQQVKAWIYQNYMQNPLVMQNPAGIWKLSEMGLKSSDIEDVEEIIGPKPTQNVAGITPSEENYLMMQGRKIQTNETDNVMEHLMTHYSFRSSADFAMMPPEYRGMFDEHMQATKAQMQMQSQQAMQPQNAPQPEQGGMGGQQPTEQGIPGGPGGIQGMGNPVPENPLGLATTGPESAS